MTNERKPREVFFNRSEYNISISAGVAEDFNSPGHRLTHFLVLPDQGIDISILGLVREVLPDQPAAADRAEQARESGVKTYKESMDFSSTPVDPIAMYVAGWLEADASRPASQEEKCVHGTFNDTYVHGLQSRIAELESELEKAHQAARNTSEWIMNRERMHKQLIEELRASQEAPTWIKNDDRHRIFEDQSEFIVALQVRNSKTGKTAWEFDKIRVRCDEESFDFVYADSGESYDAWTWDCFEFYIQTSGFPVEVQCASPAELRASHAPSPATVKKMAAALDRMVRGFKESIATAATSQAAEDAILAFEAYEQEQRLAKDG